MNFSRADAEWEARYEAQRAAAEAAFQARGGLPPRHSKVNGPPLDWQRWCATLDGVPVGHCTELDVDEGWVQVYVVEPAGGSVIRLPDVPQRRLNGRVDVIPREAYCALAKSGPEIVITPDHLRGDPVPGSEIRLPKWTAEERAERIRIAAEIRARRER
jgi:hypothetical protein